MDAQLHYPANAFDSMLDWLVQATGSNTVGLSGVELNSVLLKPVRGPAGNGAAGAAGGAGGAGGAATGGWEAQVVFTRIERDR